MLEHASVSGQIYQVDMLESENEPEKTSWGDEHEEILGIGETSVPIPIDEPICDFNLEDALERNLASEFYEVELDDEKLVDSEKVDELTLVIEAIEKIFLEDKMHKSFEKIVLKQLHEHYYSFLGKDGRRNHHSLEMDGCKNHHSPHSVESLAGL